MKTLTLTSAQNDTFKDLKALTTAKGIKQQQKFLISGEKLVLEILNKLNTQGSSTGISKNIRSTVTENVQSMDSFQSRYEIESLINSTTHKDTLALEKLCHINVKKTVLAAELFNELDVLGTHAPLLLLQFKKPFFTEASSQIQGIEIVTPLGDPKNLGSLARTALAFGFKRLLLTDDSAHPFLPTSLKASSGAVLEIDWMKMTGSIHRSELGLPITSQDYGLHMEGQHVGKVQWPKNLRLWIGEEGPGLPVGKDTFKNLNLVRIPTENVESLNATVAASLVLWEIKKSRS